MTYTFGLTNLAGVPLGKIENAYERRWQPRLNGMATASVQVRLADRRADDIINARGDVLLKVYKSGTTPPVFNGEFINGQVVGAEDGSLTMACNFADPMFKLRKRIIGQIAEGTRLFAGTTMDQVLAGLVDGTNTELGDCGIRTDGTFDTLYPVEGWGPEWSFKQISEAFTDVQEAKVAYPIGLDAYAQGYDHFNQTGGVTIGGQTAGSGQTWAQSGDAYGAAFERFTVVDAEDRLVIRNATPHVVGQYAILGSAPASELTDTVVQVDSLMVTPGPTVTGVAYGYEGVVGRWNSVTDFIFAGVTFGTSQAYFVIMRVHGGSTTIIAQTPISIPLDTYYTTRMVIDTNGYITAWFYYTGTSIETATSLQVLEPLCVTGQAMEKGLTGIFDYNASANVWYRAYDNFYMQPIGTPQSFDFKLTPTEPTADGIGVQLASLSVESLIGQDRPNAVFEYGDGTRSAKSFQWLIDREGLCNNAWAISETDARTYTNAASVAARGYYQEVVPNDLQNSALRLALVTAHATLRGTPREIITIDPSSTAPVFLTDYEVGDSVRGRFKNPRVPGTSYFGEPPRDTFRVYGVDVVIDNNGKVTETPMLVPD